MASKILHGALGTNSALPSRSNHNLLSRLVSVPQNIQISRNSYITGLSNSKNHCG